jgi:hypothetical protein
MTSAMDHRGREIEKEGVKIQMKLQQRQILLFAYFWVYK